MRRLALAVTAALVVLCAACTGGDPEVPADTTASADASSTSAPPTTTSAPTPPSLAITDGDAVTGLDDAGSSPDERGSDDDGRGATHAAVHQLLADFDRALTDLYAEPLAAADPSHPLTVAWHGVVVPDTAFDRELRTRIVTAGRDHQMRVVPRDGDATSFVNVALDLTHGPDGTVGWENCGYSPGVGRHVDTGAVIDDGRASTIGHGRARWSADQTLELVELVDDDTVLLEPDEDDPCPSRLDATTTDEESE